MKETLEEYQRRLHCAHTNWDELVEQHYDGLQELSKLKERYKELLELAKELRCYTHEWDWKYGEEWDEELEKANKVVEDLL